MSRGAEDRDSRLGLVGWCAVLKVAASADCLLGRRNAQTLAAAEILALGLSIPGILAEVTAQTQGPVTKGLTQAIQQGLGDTQRAAA